MFNSSRRATAELSAYAHCGCTHALERRRSALDVALERVVIFDIRFDWNGIGNSLPRWLALLRVGLAAGRASYLWMSTEDERFDLGEYFESTAVDWSWRRQQKRVTSAFARRNVSAGEASLTCAAATHACMRPGIAGRDGVSLIEGTHEQERDGLLLEWLAGPSSPPFLVLRVRQQTLLEPSAAVAAAWLAGDRGPAHRTAAFTPPPPVCARARDTRGSLVAGRHAREPARRGGRAASRGSAPTARRSRCSGRGPRCSGGSNRSSLGSMPPTPWSPPPAHRRRRLAPPARRRRRRQQRATRLRRRRRRAAAAVFRALARDRRLSPRLRRARAPVCRRGRREPELLPLDRRPRAEPARRRRAVRARRRGGGGGAALPSDGAVAALVSCAARLAAVAAAARGACSHSAIRPASSRSPRRRRAARSRRTH